MLLYSREAAYFGEAVYFSEPAQPASSGTSAAVDRPG